MMLNVKTFLIFSFGFFGFQNNSFAQQCTTNTPAGQSVYAAQCASCHGSSGLGDGNPKLVPPPRNFTTPTTGFVTPPSPTLPTAKTIASTVDTGLNKNEMPNLSTTICQSDIDAVASYIMAQFVVPNVAHCSPDYDGYDPTTVPTACITPTGYSLDKTVNPYVNRPNLPYYNGSTKMTDFFPDPSTKLTAGAPLTGSNQHYPVCGAGRIAVASNGSVQDISTSFEPNSTSTSPMVKPNANGFGAFPYATTGPNGPQYLYGPGFRCACASPSYTAPITPGTGKVISSIPSDLFGVIAAPNPPTKYTPVAIALDGQSDGRMGSVYGSSGVGGTGNSQCGCPNINEQMVSLDGTNTSAYCQTMIGSTTPAGLFVADQNAILVTYNPNQTVISPSNEISNPKTGIVTTVALPIVLGGIQTKSYQRRIWVCASGFVLGGNNTCIPSPSAQNACDDGSIASSPSAVSGTFSTEAALALQFKNTVNKKMACCMNVFTPGLSNLKYDCIDNSAPKQYATFDDLWFSADPSTGGQGSCTSNGIKTNGITQCKGPVGGGATGAQLNALVLSNAKGQPITGFYKLNGERCKEYSEFGTSGLQPGIIDLKTGIFKNGGSKLASGSLHAPPTPPMGPPLNFTYPYTSNPADVPPLTAAGAGVCPILVRAAMVATCPTNPTSASAAAVPQTLICDGDSPCQPGDIPVRCTAASKIQVHVQVMQLTQIVGKLSLKTVDSVMSSNQAANISVSNIITKKNGGVCPDGAVLMGTQCVNQ